MGQYCDSILPGCDAITVWKICPQTAEMPKYSQLPNLALVMHTHTDRHTSWMNTSHAVATDNQASFHIIQGNRKTHPNRAQMLYFHNGKLGQLTSLYFQKTDIWFVINVRSKKIPVYSSTVPMPRFSHHPRHLIGLCIKHTHMLWWLWHPNQRCMKTNIICLIGLWLVFKISLRKWFENDDVPLFKPQMV